jgi:hypothetical protein
MPLQEATVKKLLVLILTLVIVPMVAGAVWVEVREADGETPFDGRDIMVGTNLTLVVCSDSNDYWSGGLFIEDQNRALGTLEGRDYDPNRLMYDPNRSLNWITQYIEDWAGSHYEGAGELARVTAWEDSNMWGFDLYTSDINDSNFVAGDWFIIDYYADEVGDCNVGFYDYSISWDDPNYCISFFHIPTRDLNSDGKVNFIDFAIFALQWESTNCNDPNWCDGADLDLDGDVDYNDLGLFVEYWPWRSSHTDPGEDPNYPEDPNVTYSIVDASSNSEITMDVGDSITLYVDMVTTELNNICLFNIEVNISDPNLGSIDNTAYDPDDPPGPGTARILAEPRNEEFDYWGPGFEQEEGIQLCGANMSSAMFDGHLASFVFTCESQGDVTLELVNWDSLNTDGEKVFPKLESIIIHQVDPNS